MMKLNLFIMTTEILLKSTDIGDEVKLEVYIGMIERFIDKLAYIDMMKILIHI